MAASPAPVVTAELPVPAAMKPASGRSDNPSQTTETTAGATAARTPAAGATTAGATTAGATTETSGSAPVVAHEPSHRPQDSRPQKASPGKAREAVRSETHKQQLSARAAAAVVQTIAPVLSSVLSPAVPKSAETLPEALANRSIESSGQSSISQSTAADEAQPASTTAVSAAAIAESLVDQLAFAVKVQPIRSAPLSSRSVADASTVVGSKGESGVTSRQTPSGNPAVRDSSDADVSADADHAASEASTLSEGKTRVGEKKEFIGGDPKQNAETQSALGVQSSAGSHQLPHEAGEAPARPGVAVSSETTSKGSAPGEAAQATAAPDGHLQTTTPMRDLSVRVEAAEGQKVDVRIVQRAGDLQIAVKSADVDTTQGLRHGLSELASRLNESGYHAETWRPGQAAPADTGGGSGNDSQNSQDSPSGGSQSNSSWSQQNQGQRDNNPSNRPRWIQELESNTSSGNESTGKFHGLIS